MEIIAEVGLAHDGSLSQAHGYVHACGKAGVNTVKFQCHLGDPCTAWRVVPPYWQQETRTAYWERTGFTAEQWSGLRAHCGDAGVEFLCSPFSVQAAGLLNPLVSRWKVPSGRVADVALLDVLGATGKPVLLSSGMSTLAEVGHAQTRLTAAGCAVQLMQCTSAYPCLDSWVDLGKAAEWGGLSDHSGTIYPGLAAAALGCKVLEVHVCWSKEQRGLDTAASLDMGQLRQLVEGVRFIEGAKKPVDKDAMAGRLSETRRVFM